MPSIISPLLSYYDDDGTMCPNVLVSCVSCPVNRSCCVYDCERNSVECFFLKKRSFLAKKIFSNIISTPQITKRTDGNREFDSRALKTTMTAKEEEEEEEEEE